MRLPYYREQREPPELKLGYHHGRVTALSGRLRGRFVGASTLRSELEPLELRIRLVKLGLRLVACTRRPTSLRPLRRLQYPELGVHDAPIFPFTMLRNPHHPSAMSLA